MTSDVLMPRKRHRRAVFVIGRGRGGLAVQMAAMHPGLCVHVAGEVAVAGGAIYGAEGPPPRRTRSGMS